jgi:hypothetical protein
LHRASGDLASNANAVPDDVRALYVRMNEAVEEFRSTCSDFDKRETGMSRGQINHLRRVLRSAV